MIGRPPIYSAVQATCEYCGILFSRKPYGNDRLRFCGKVCRNLARPCKGQPRKLPTRDEVVRLYVEEHRTLVEIARMYGANHKSVHAQLRLAGVKCRHHRLVCKIEGCGKPALKIKHVALNTEYGTLCAEHREIHYRLLNRALHRKNRNINPSRFNPWRYKETEQERAWLRKNRDLLRQAKTLSLLGERLPDVSQSPKKVLRLVTTSPE